MSSRFPPPSRPLRVEGGLRARSRRGPIAQTWWSERFVAVLESIGLGNRLERGRTYARAGQVLDLRVDPGAVTAAVQGSRRAPYRVRVGVLAFGKAEWARVAQALADDAWYAAALLSGELPAGIEDIFAAAGLPLFPERAADLAMDCSCPDGAVPCKHLAAVLYLLAETFDSDPFAILAWRGRGRAELLAALDDLRAVGGPDPDRLARAAGRQSLSACLDSYWVGAPAALPRLAPAGGAGSVLDGLPPIGVAVRGTDLADLLRPAYRAAASPAVPRAEQPSPGAPSAVVRLGP